MLEERMTWALRIATLTILLAGAEAANLTGQSLELISRVHPDRISDTGAAAGPPNGGNVRTFSLSDDGRYVAFLSTATNLAPGQQDTNSNSDVFLKDLLTGTTTLVSRSLTSPVAAGNQGSEEAVISGDGRYIAFVSRATDLAPGQQGGTFGSDQDLLLYDRIADTLLVVAAADASGFGDLSISADGRFLAFASSSSLLPGDPPGPGLYLYDRVEGAIRQVGQPALTGGRTGLTLSPDGRFVFYLVSDLEFEVIDPFLAFLFDRISGAVTPLGRAQAGAAFSADGRYLAFTGVRHLSLRDLQTGITTPLAAAESGSFSQDRMAFSADGRFLVFSSSAENLPGSSLNASAVYLYDRIMGAFTLVSRRHGSPLSEVSASQPSISGDGRYIVFASAERDLVSGQADAEGIGDTLDVFLFDRATGATTLVSAKGSSPSETGAGSSSHPLISRDGARIVFESYAGDLVAGVKDFNLREDVYVYETASGNEALVSARALESPSLAPSAQSAARALSADGRFVAFVSDSTDLIPGLEDANDTTDLFLYDTQTKSVLLVSHAQGAPNRTANGRSVGAAISTDGRYVLFASDAEDLAPGTPDLEQGAHLFLFDRTTGSTRFVGTSQYAVSENFVAAMTPDGRWVAYTNYTSDLVPGLQESPEGGGSDVFLCDRVTGSTILVSRSTRGATVTGNDDSSSPELSADGRYIAFSSQARDLVPGQVDNHNSSDLFLFDRITGKTALASRAQRSAVTATHAGGFFSLSADGRFLVFDALTTDHFLAPTGVYLYDRTAGTRQLLDSPAFAPRISADGRYIAWLRNQPRDAQGNFVPPHLYLYDRTLKTLRPITPAAPGGAAHGRVEDGFVLSGDGRYVAFESDATYLIPGQVSAPGREGSDLFLFDRVSGSTTLISRSPASPKAAMGESGNPLLSASGLRLAFTSTAALRTDDFNDLSDAYLFSVPAAPGGTIPLTPCKLLDTRRRADRPALRSDTRRTVRAAGVCGVPAAAKSVSVTVTALQATGKGNLRFYAGNNTATASGTLRFEKNATRSSTFTVPLATNGAGTLAILPFVAGKGTVQVVVEVNGYSQ